MVQDSPQLPAVIDVPGERLELVQDGVTAELLYRLGADRMILVHTEVPDEISGRGIGSALVRSAVERAAAEGLTVVPWCPFARRWLRRHPDVAATVAVDWTSRPTT